MQIHQVVPVVEIPIAETGRKPRPLRLSTIAECDELIIAVTRAKNIILAAHAAIEEAEAVLMVAPQGEHPYPGKIVCNAPGFLPDSWCKQDAMVPHMHEDAEGRKWGVAPVTPLDELPRRNARPDGESREFPYPAPGIGLVADCRERDGSSICVRPKLHRLPHRDEHGREWGLHDDLIVSAAPEATSVPEFGPYLTEMVCQFHGGTSTEESACPVCRAGDTDVAAQHDAEASQS